MPGTASVEQLEVAGGQRRRDAELPHDVSSVDEPKDAKGFGDPVEPVLREILNASMFRHSTMRATTQRLDSQIFSRSDWRRRLRTFNEMRRGNGWRLRVA